MTRKKTLKKQKFCLDGMSIVKSKAGAKLYDHDPRKFFKCHEKVAEALLNSLEENNAPAFLEILNTYLQINKTKTARETDLSRTTVQNALSSKGNPTIRTIAKIVHHSSPSTHYSGR